MTFTVMHHRTILGTTQYVGTAQDIALKEFERFSKRIAVPTGPGGIHIPPFWSKQSEVPGAEKWYSHKDDYGNVYWDLSLGSLADYYAGFNLRIYFTVERENDLFTSDIVGLGIFHYKFNDPCKNCEGKWWSSQLEVDYWPIDNEDHKNQVRAMIMYQSCPAFRKAANEMIALIREE